MMAVDGVIRYWELMEMYNPDILVRIIVSEIFRNQASVAFLRSIFCTEETAVVEVFNLVSFLDMSFLQ